MEKIRLDIQKFASGTIDGSSTASRCDCRIVWSSTSNGSSDNSSSVTASIQILKTGSGTTTGTFSGTITINGTNYNVSKKFSPYNYGNWATVGSKTVTIPHNVDGTKTITISGKLTQTGTTMAGTYTASGTAVLDTIDRLSTITNVTKTTIDKPFSIKFPDYGLYYDLHVSYINSETLTGGIVLEVRDVKNNTNYYIPSEVIPGLYEVFTGSSGINLWVKLNVYADEARTKPIYTNSSQDSWESIVVNFGYGNIPPTASIEITGEQNTTMKSLNWGIYVQGKSQIGVQINGTAQYGATITGRSSSTNGITYNQSSYTTGTITAPGDNLVKARVTDSRGQQSSEVSSSYYVYPYAQPSVTLHSAERCDENGNVNDKGTYLRIAFSSNIYACNNNNSKSISVYAGDYSSVISTSYSNNQTVSIVNANLSSSASYDIKLKATDSFTTVTSNTIRLSTSDLADIFHFNKSGKSLAIGCKSTRGENEKALDIGLDTTISGKFITSTYGNNNTIDTWVPVWKDGYLEHRVIPSAYNNAPSTLNVNYANSAGSANSATSSNIQTPYSIYGAAGDFKWVRLGVWTSDGDNSNIELTIHSGSGYNGLAYQNSKVVITIKDGWQSAVSTSTAFGVTCEFFQNVDRNFKVKVQATSHNICQVWVYMPWQYWNGDYNVIGRGTWINNITNQTNEPTSGVDQEVMYIEYKKTPTILYNNGSGTTGNVTLSETANNFEYLEIYYMHSGGDDAFKSVKIHAPNGKKAKLDAMYDNGTYLYFYTESASISGTTITRGTKVRWRVAASTAAQTRTVDTNCIYIKRVVGYR